MGVTGAGKSTVGALLAERTGGCFLEGDRLHPASNQRKMSHGQPLDDAEREPWLGAIVTEIRQQLARGSSVVVACSALRRRYRELLRQAHGTIRFVHLAADAELLRDRLHGRTGHFMPAALLDSQLATLEPPSDEADAVTIHLVPGDSPERIVARIVRALPE